MLKALVMKDRSFQISKSRQSNDETKVAFIKLMTDVKHDEFSMYPKNIQRVFNYDNETVFSYWVKAREIQIQYMSKEWHWIVDELITEPKHIDPKAKLYHLINKKMEWIEDINKNK